MENKIIKITLWMNGRAFEYHTVTISDAFETLQSVREFEPAAVQNWTDDELMISLAEMAAGTRLGFSNNCIDVKRYRADQV